MTTASKILVDVNIYFLFPVGLALNIVTMIVFHKTMNQKSITRFFLTQLIISSMITSIMFEIYYIHINHYLASKACHILKFLFDTSLLWTAVCVFFTLLVRYLEMKSIHVKLFNTWRFYASFNVMVILVSACVHSVVLISAEIDVLRPNESLNNFLDCHVYSKTSLLLIDSIEILIDLSIPLSSNFVLTCMISRKIIESKVNLSKSMRSRNNLNREWRFVRNLQVFNVVNVLIIPVVAFRVYKHVYIENSLGDDLVTRSANEISMFMETLGHFLIALRFFMPAIVNMAVNHLFRKNLVKMVSFKKKEVFV